MASKQKSKLPISDSRTKFEGVNRVRAINSATLWEPSSSNGSRGSICNIQNHFTLGGNITGTPNQRLKRFKAIRDKNSKELLKQRKFKKMSVDLDKKNKVQNGKQEITEATAIKEKLNSKNSESITNGDSQNTSCEPKEISAGVKLKEENHSVVDSRNKANGEASLPGESDSPSANEKVEAKEVDEKELVKKDEMEHQNLGEDEHRKFEEDVVSIDTEGHDACVVNNGVIETNNDKSQTKEEKCDKVDMDEIEEEDNVQNKKEDVLTKEVSTSLEPSLSENTSHFKIEQLAKQPLDKDYSVSYETKYHLIAKTRIGGRRPLRQTKVQSKKRKLERNDSLLESTIYPKKKVLPFLESDASSGSPSVLSPGWRFIPSPLSRLWSSQDTSVSGHTPYKSIPSTPYLAAEDQDSMIVNFDDKSIFNNLNDTELGLSSDTSQPAGSNWRCALM